MNNQTSSNRCLSFFAAALLCSAACDSFASPIMFEGNNPALFNTAPPNGQALMLLSTNKSKNDPHNKGDHTTPTGDSGELVQQSVLNALSNEIQQQILNSSNASGTFDLGNSRTISYIRTGGNIIITIFDPAKGPTVITIPDV